MFIVVTNVTLIKFRYIEQCGYTCSNVTRLFLPAWRDWYPQTSKHSSGFALYSASFISVTGVLFFLLNVWWWPICTVCMFFHIQLCICMYMYIQCIHACIMNFANFYILSVVEVVTAWHIILIRDQGHWTIGVVDRGLQTLYNQLDQHLFLLHLW